MARYHLGEPAGEGRVRPTCGADAREPCLTPESFAKEARRGGPVCDACVTIATDRAERPPLRKAG